MNQERKNQAVEDLKFVRKVMENCARKQQDDGVYFIIWGLLIPIATIVTNVCIHFEQYKLIGLVWLLSCLIGTFTSVFIGIKQNIKKTASQGVKLQSIIWLSCYISMLLMAISAFISKAIGFNEIMAMLSFILAIGVFISGFLSGTKLLRFMAIGWWITGMVCAFTKNYDASIVVTISTFCLFFIPGIILHLRSKKNENKVL